MKYTYRCIEIYLIGLILLNYALYSDASLRGSRCFPQQSLSSSAIFACRNGFEIERSLYCNRVDDCGDNSDEEYCIPFKRRPAYMSYNSYSSDENFVCSENVPLYHCSLQKLCIPSSWRCDSRRDCQSGEDEVNCPSLTPPLLLEVDAALTKAEQWMSNQFKSASATEKWGMFVHKKAVSLFLAGRGPFSSSDNLTRTGMGYEISLKLLSQLTRIPLEEIPSTDLASFVNALLVTCLNPKEFHGMNLVEELRSRATARNYTNPYVFLTLCNAGEIITESDKQRLVDVFWNERRVFWTDMRALVVMALSCASHQTDTVVTEELLKELTSSLKSYQYRNGTVENLQTTALVLQALYASEPEADPDSFDEMKALQQILQKQNSDGSFGNFMKTYYVLPVLSCKSLVNISSKHCQEPPKDEETAEQYLLRQTGPKVHIEYSIWIGNERNIERTLALRVPVNASLYRMMEISSDLDPKYKFEYVMKNRKPYINGISGLLDDPESGKFWFLYKINDTKPTHIEKSPAEVKLKENEHFVMWYRRSPWMENIIPDLEDNKESV